MWRHNIGARPALVAAVVAAVVIVVGAVLITRPSPGLGDIETLPPGLYTVERTGEAPIYVWWESFDRYYSESGDGTEFINHTLREGSLMTSWQSGNIVDPSLLDLDGRAATEQELADLGFGTVPRTADVGGDPVIPNGALTPPGLLSDEFEVDGLAMTREGERISFTDAGVPMSASWVAPNGEVVTTAVSFSPDVEVGVIEPGCAARSAEALAIQAQYPYAGC
jgi:hypothetical protein